MKFEPKPPLAVKRFETISIATSIRHPAVVGEWKRMLKASGLTPAQLLRQMVYQCCDVEYDFSEELFPAKKSSK